jgi:anthranilate synthase/aminodeoxychorismate synthase-like glutamine amidotransferase
MRILLLDNFDSYTYNLYQYTGEILKKEQIDGTVEVKRNNEITLEEIRNKNYSRIIISPGPGDPSDTVFFGVCGEVLVNISPHIPTLGICLGMQGLAHYFGGKVTKANVPMHGKTSNIVHDEHGLFRGLPQGIEVMRYHSLVADANFLPDCFEATAYVADDNKIKSWPLPANFLSGKDIMGIRHKALRIEGVQFHPESFATEGGLEMIKNFLLNSDF